MFRKISKTQEQLGIIFQQPKFAPNVEASFFSEYNHFGLKFVILVLEL